jgi:hypothetical protein
MLQEVSTTFTKKKFLDTEPLVEIKGSTPFKFLFHETEVADGFPLMKQVIVTLFVPRMAEYDGCGMVTVKKSKIHKFQLYFSYIFVSNRSDYRYIIYKWLKSGV